jgi:capsular polysaccharide biosynthesis protein
MSPLAPTPALSIAIGILAALQVALGAAMIAQEATR